MRNVTEIKVRDESHNPIKWTLRAKVLGTVGVAAAGTFLGSAVANKASADNRHNAVVQELEQSSSSVKADMTEGKINPNDVSLVPAPEGGYASDVAAAIVGQGRDHLEVQHIISAQTDGSNRVYKGEEFVLPNVDIPHSNNNSAH